MSPTTYPDWFLSRSISSKDVSGPDAVAACCVVRCGRVAMSATAVDPADVQPSAHEQGKLAPDQVHKPVFRPIAPATFCASFARFQALPVAHFAGFFEKRAVSIFFVFLGP